jgi:hypothetical protein
METASRTNLRRRKRITERLWKRILASIPIPCVDVIVYRKAKRETRVLLGYRKMVEVDRVHADKPIVGRGAEADL